MTENPSVLLLEDSLPQATIFKQYLKDEAINLSHAETGEAAKQFIAATPPQLILLDLVLPDMDGREVLEWMQQENISTTVVVLTAHSSVDTAVDVMRIGAEDFLEKPVSASRLKTTVRNLLEKNRLQNLVENLQDTFDRRHYHGFIGSSLPMQAVYRIIDAAAPSKASIFITGESGTGKEVCAEAIHKQGSRAEQPFVAINCAAIPRELMESEIFGHVKGAFTGAVTQREGAASRAHGGTLFLDEIGEMDIELQTKLLRFVQTGSFQKVGGTRLEEVDVRFISATNRDPLEAVKSGDLREDLYYRLHVVPIHLPPLRERRDDIMAIARNFLVSYTKEEDKHFKAFSAEVEGIFCDYNWPGNVRQLINVVRNIVVLHDHKTVLPMHLPAPLNLDMRAPESVNSIPSTPVESVDKAPDISSIRPLAIVERELIENAIKSCHGNVPRAAALLEVSPSTIYRKKQAWEKTS
ncbi:MAG: sigma-54-dependent Fis family transcriptional regulator [Proteobacteria bacterium]|nr:sigma-54-dependent Fis family transcriptional regulator [Pseudomonadota bacterium]